MGEPIFLISGATGATGGAAAEQLLAKSGTSAYSRIGRTTVPNVSSNWAPRLSSAISWSLRKCAAH